VVEVVALTGPLADPREDRHAAVLHREVVDELLDDDGLADAGAAEEPDLATALVGREQVDDLDAGLEGRHVHVEVDQQRRILVDRVVAHGLDGAEAVDRLADDVLDAPERALADRHRDGGAGVLHLQPAHQAVRRVHRDGADGVVAEVHRHLEHEVELAVVDGLVGDPQGRVDAGKPPRRELDVDDRADDLGDRAHREGGIRCCCHG